MNWRVRVIARLKKVFTAEYLPFFAITLVIFISSYWNFKNLGVYGDDWGAGTFIFNHNLKDVVQEWWRAGSGEISNFRPLAVILPIAWFFAFSSFGSSGVIFFNLICYAAVAYILYILLRYHVSNRAAFFATLIFAVFPSNNAYLWHVTLSYTVALLLVLVAVQMFYKKHWIYAALLLAASLLMNEAVFFVFVFALLPPKTKNWNEIKPTIRPWAFLVTSLLIVYIIVRLLLEKIGVTGGSRLDYAMHNFSMWLYIWQFVKAEAVVLVVSAAGAWWKVFNFFKTLNLLVGFSVILTAYSVSRVLKRDIVTKTQPWYLLLAGIILICAGRYYGFFYIPSVNIFNLDSRYYFAASIGGVVFIASLIEILLKSVKQWVRIFGIVMCMLTLGVFTMSRFAVQRDYVDVWVNSREVWKQLFQVLPQVPENGFVLLDIPKKTLGKPVVEFEAVGDLRLTLPLISNGKINGVTTPFVESFHWQGDYLCVTAPPIYNERCFRKDLSYGFVWYNKQLQQTFGPTLQPQVQDYTNTRYKENLLEFMY